MNETLQIGVQTALVGLGATLAMDIWRFFLQQAFGVSSLDLKLLGRWVGHLLRGRLAHAGIAQSQQIRGEVAIGWGVHYLIGLSFAALLPLGWGLNWLQSPTLVPALLIGWATVLAPWFIMQPAMGMGVAASRTAKPNAVRLRNLAIHSVYGFGLYGSALISQRLVAQ